MGRMEWNKGENITNDLFEGVYLCKETFTFYQSILDASKYWFETYLIYYRTNRWIHIISLDIEYNYIPIANIVN